MKKIFLLIAVFCFVFSMQVVAKNHFDNNSLELLKTFNNEGKIIRANDEPIQKADISQDTIKVKQLKQKFKEDCYNYLDKTSSQSQK